MKWGYALIRHYDPKMSRKVKRKVEWYRIHEVWLTEKRKFTLWSEDPMEPGGDTPDEVRADLSHMLADSFKGVIDCTKMPGKTPCKQCKRKLRGKANKKSNGGKRR